MKRHLRYFVIFSIVFSMFLNGLPISAFAFSSQNKGRSVGVYIRVEGYDETIVPRRRIVVDNFDLSSYIGKNDGIFSAGPTPVHALIKALEDEGINCKWDLILKNDNGVLKVIEVKDDKENKCGSKSGWMVRIDDELKNHDYCLSDRDDIVWYYGAYGEDTLCSIISANTNRVKPGDDVNISLLGLSGKSTAKGKVERATVYVDGIPYIRDGKPEETNSSGSARVKFEYPGNYVISAERFRGDKRDIVRPDPIMISVTGEPELDEDNKSITIPTSSDPVVTPSPKRLKIYDELDTAVSALLFSVKDIQNKGYESIREKATNVADILKRTSKIAANANTSTDVLQKSNILLETMVEASKKTKEKHDLDEIWENTSIALDAATAVIHQVSDEQSMELVKQIIHTVGNFSEIEAQYEQVLNQKVIKLSRIVLENNVNRTISKESLVAEDNNVTCLVKEDDLEDLIAKAFELAETLDEALVKNRITHASTLKGQIVIDVSSRGKQQIKAVFTENTFDNITRRGIKNVGIKTSLGQIFLTPDSFKRQSDQKDATIIISSGSLENSKGSFLPESNVMSIEALVDNNKIEAFEKPVEVRISYEVNPVDIENIKIYCIKNDGSIESIDGRFDSVFNNVVFYTDSPGTFVINKE